MTVLAQPRSRRTPRPARPRERVSGLWLLMASEALSGLAGFAVLMVLARRLGPNGLASLEFASVVVGLSLVWVRSGFETIVSREAARRPRLIGPLTDTLLGLKLLTASIGYASICLFGTAAGRFGVFAIAGLVLFPSAMIAEVRPRASGRLAIVALAQVLRAAGLGAAVLVLVSGPADVRIAASCAAIAETVSAVVLGISEVRTRRIVHCRFRLRLLIAILRRGLIASLSRFGRVVLYGADLLVLGSLALEGLGSFVAARRVVFALVSLGLVVPGAMAPAIARAWASGVDPARKRIGRTAANLMALALPACLGLVLTSDGWMRLLFGRDYPGGAIALTILAARLPPLLLATLHQTALVALRRERDSARIVFLTVISAAILVPLSATRFGPLGAGLAMVVVETIGVALGWLALKKLGAAPPWFHADRSTFLACALMVPAVWVFAHSPVWLASLAGAAAYGMTFWIARRSGIE